MERGRKVVEGKVERFAEFERRDRRGEMVCVRIHAKKVQAKERGREEIDGVIVFAQVVHNARGFAQVNVQRGERGREVKEGERVVRA